MRKPTAKEWEREYDCLIARLETFLPEGMIRIERMLKWIDEFDPRQKPYYEPSSMSLSEIVAIAEPEDRFTSRERTGEIRMGSDNTLTYASTHGPILLTKADFESQAWYFTKRRPRCPNCGHKLEKE